MLREQHCSRKNNNWTHIQKKKHNAQMQRTLLNISHTIKHLTLQDKHYWQNIQSLTFVAKKNVPMRLLKACAYAGSCFLVAQLPGPRQSVRFPTKPNKTAWSNAAAAGILAVVGGWKWNRLHRRTLFHAGYDRWITRDSSGSADKSEYARASDYPDKACRANTAASIWRSLPKRKQSQ